jgi:hypothetical protein
MRHEFVAVSNNEIKNTCMYYRDVAASPLRAIGMLLSASLATASEVAVKDVAGLAGALAKANVGDTLVLSEGAFVSGITGRPHGKKE